MRLAHQYLSAGCGLWAMGYGRWANRKLVLPPFGELSNSVAPGQTKLRRGARGMGHEAQTREKAVRPPILHSLSSLPHSATQSDPVAPGQTKLRLRACLKLKRGGTGTL